MLLIHRQESGKDRACSDLGKPLGWKTGPAWTLSSSFLFLREGDVCRLVLWVSVWKNFYPASLLSVSLQELIQVWVWTFGKCRRWMAHGLSRVPPGKR